MLPSQLLDLLEEGMEFGAMTVDTETSGLYADDGARVSTLSLAFVHPKDDRLPESAYRVETILGEDHPIYSFAWPFDQGVAGTGKPEDDGQGVLWSEADNLPQKEWVALCGLLEMVGNAHGLIMHNSKFDCEKIREGVRRWPNVGVDLMDLVVWDTQNANHYLYPLERTSLKPTVERLFGTEFGDESRLVKDYLKKKKLPAGRWDLMPWDIIGEYADMDARITFMLYLYQIADIESRDLDPQERAKIYDALTRRLATTRVLYRMERRGIPYDEIASRDAAKLARKRAAEALEGLPYRTDNQAKAYYFGDEEGQLGMVPYAVSDKTGEPSMTAEILQRMVDDEVPHIKQWAEHRKAKSAASMWYEAYADAIGNDGRIRTCFRQNGTTSSRFSVERINLQAIPQDYRLSSHSVLEGIPTPRALIAKAVAEFMPGWAMWELDLAQAELRVGAMFAKCTPMLNMINAGQDLHDYTTKALFDIGPDDPEFFRYRQVGKRANFSLLFGAGGNTFRKMVSKETGIQLGEAEAERLVREWNGLYPQFGAAIDKHSSVVARRQAKRGRGWVDLTDNERRWFDKYEDTHKALNQRVQGNLAQFGINWMLKSEAFLSEALDGRKSPDGGEGGLVLVVHDSQVLLLPDSHAEELVTACANLGKDLWQKYFPGVPGDVDAKTW